MKNIDTEAQYRTNVVIWGALLTAQILFLVTLFFSKNELFQFDFSQPALGANALLVAAFAALALTNLALSFFLKKQAVKRAAEEQNPALLQTGTIIACAFCEAISLLGMVLAFAFNYQYFFLWFAAGIAGIILHFPRRADVLAANYKKF